MTPDEQEARDRYTDRMWDRFALLQTFVIHGYLAHQRDDGWSVSFGDYTIRISDEQAQIFQDVCATLEGT